MILCIEDTRTRFKRNVELNQTSVGGRALREKNRCVFGKGYYADFELHDDNIRDEQFEIVHDRSAFLTRRRLFLFD